jgi:type I restriction enzyme, S subunit
MMCAVLLQPLGSCSLVIAGQSPDGKFYNGSGEGIPFYQGKKDFGARELLPPRVWTTHTTKEAYANDILMSVRAPVGPVNFARRTVCIGRGLAAIRCLDGLDPEFLFYQLLGMQRMLAGKEGAVFSSISRAEIEALPIYVPSLPEQRRLVAILDEAFDGISVLRSHAEKKIQYARMLLESRMRGHFSSDQGWERVSLEELLSRGWIASHLDGNHGSDYPRKEEFLAEGVPYIAASAIRGGEVDFSEARYLAPQRAASIRKGLAKDRDVLFAHNATVGPVAVLRTNEEVVVLGTSLTYYRCDPERVHPEYLAHFMASPAFTSQYAQVMKQSTRNQVPITKQREFMHVVPPIDVQRQIAHDLDGLSVHVSRLVRVESQKLMALGELEKSLLYHAFGGSLTSTFADQPVPEHV